MSDRLAWLERCCPEAVRLPGRGVRTGVGAAGVAPEPARAPTFTSLVAGLSVRAQLARRSRANAANADRQGGFSG